MQSKQKAPETLQAQRIQSIKEAGIDVHSFSPYHYRLGGPNGPIDYWPSSDHWSRLNTIIDGYGHESAINEFKVNRKGGRDIPAYPKTMGMAKVSEQATAAITPAREVEYDKQIFDMDSLVELFGDDRDKQSWGFLRAKILTPQ